MNDGLAGLVEERDFLLRSLDDLDREAAAGDLDGPDATELRDDYTRRLAGVQRAIEGASAPTVAAEPARTVATEPARTVATRSSSTGGRGWARRAVAAVIVVGLAGGAGLGVAASMGERRPGQTITGGTPRTTESLLDEAARLGAAGQALEAIKAYQRVLERQPQNVEALAERGFLLLRVAAASGGSTGGGGGLIGRGKRSVEQALAARPGDPRILFYLGVALVLEGDQAGADAVFDDALAKEPSDDVRAAIEEFRGGIATPSGGSTSSGGSTPSGGPTSSGGSAPPG